MSEEKKPKKKLSASPKEHKKPWQEAYATVGEIEAMLSERVLLRYNEVRGRTEIHWLSQGPVIGENEQGLLTIFGGDGGVTDGYTNLDDRDINTLWTEFCREKPVIKQHLLNVIESDYVPAYHPFRYYLEHLPPWKEDQGDHIMGLSLSVNVKGDSDEQILFYEYLRKWLVAMVASWVDDRVVNNVMLVLIGELASFCGTGNSQQFLSDTTGTRRWLPFVVESIESPLSSPFDYDGIYSQAYALYRQGFRYWFDKAEIERLQRHNELFESPCTERELVFWNFRPPKDGEQGEFMPVGLAMQIVSGQISAKITKEQMGHAFIDLGFERRTFRNVRGYIVVRRSIAETESLRRELATPDTHTPDTPVF